MRVHQVRKLQPNHVLSADWTVSKGLTLSIHPLLVDEVFLAQQVREFAEQVLFADTLEGKLCAPMDLTDTVRGPPIPVPDRPKRPPELSFESTRPRKPFPKLSHLDRPGTRGEVLHHFANHELLAMEIMALVLLRFPDAPAAFRKTLIHTIADEQKHLKSYCKAMKDSGVVLGDLAVNDFFWRNLRHIASPMEYVVGMSLTFEQANLDFSLYWMNAFEEAGDHETASVLKEVYEDEIRHVKTGLSWFRQWRDPAESEWSSFCKHLRFPLTPMRAKGHGFSRSARSAAGLRTEFIDELAVYSHSRGRPPHVFWFSPHCDEEAGDEGYTPNKTLLAATTDLSALPLFIAHQEDTVLLSRRPGTPFLKRLMAAGFTIPEFVCTQKPTADTLGGRHIASLLPWGWSPRAARWSAPLRASVGRTERPCNSSPEWKELYSKAWSATLLQTYLDAWPNEATGPSRDTAGTVCTTLQGVLDQLNAFPLVIKAPFSTAGRNRLILEQRPTASQERWVAKMLSRYSLLVVEPWLQRTMDLSVHLDIGARSVERIGLTRFFTDNHGRYRGTLVTPWHRDLPPAIRTAQLMDSPLVPAVVDATQRVSDLITEQAQARNFRGALSFDLLLFRAGDGTIGCKPLVEINPRFTMSRVALAMKPRIAMSASAVWLTGTLSEIQEAGFSQIDEFARWLESHAPLELEDRRIQRGVLFTTDPAQASHAWSLLWVDSTVQVAAQRWLTVFTSPHCGPRIRRWAESVVHEGADNQVRPGDHKTFPAT